MRQIFILLVIISVLFLSFNTNAQSGILNGKITDEGSGQPLIGATVIIPHSSYRTITDIDGAYRLHGVAAGKQVLQVSYVGFDTKEIGDVEITPGQIVTLNITLSLSQKAILEAVVVKSTARKETTNALLSIRRNAPVVSDFISAEMIRKSPDKNIGDVLKRVSGTSVQDNKFVVVRGMSDRYNEAMLNGAVLPSTEPDRKTFAFDIFPSDVVDNITVIKSATPDLPGSFAGGLIQVNLKDVPEKNFISVKAGIGYNSISTGEVYYHDKAGNTDWLGIDDGTRDLPNGFPKSKKYNKLEPNEKLVYAQNFPNDWKLYKEGSAPVNSSLQISAGFNSSGTKHGYPSIGGLFAVGYNSTYKFSQATNKDYGQITVTPDSVDTGLPFYNYNDSSFAHNILASALGNFALKLNTNNKFFFNNLYTINSSIQTVVRNGESTVGTGILSPYFGYVHYFQSNRLYNTQLGGEHYLPKLKLKIKWLGYFTDFYRNEPDYRQMIYFTPYEGSPMYAYLGYPSLSATTVGGLRFYWTTKDQAKGVNIDISKPFKLFDNNQNLKFGFAHYYDARVRDGRFLRNDQSDVNFNQNLLLLPPDSIFDEKNFNANRGFVLTDYNEPEWFYYDGKNKNTAGYLMLDNKLTSKIRFVWGLRIEHYTNIVNSFQQGMQPYTVDTSFLDYLPSGNFIYSILPQANIRASYSRTVARPLYRELAATQFYDFFQNATFFGTTLSETHIDNYELRWEQYFPNAQYYSVSGYYKKFKDPIEQKIITSGADSKIITWQNAPSAENLGIEIEARKSFDFISKRLANLFIYTNASLIKSTAYVKGNGSDTMNRPLQGQSPYLINASLQYGEPKTGINVSILYNLIGERIALVGGLEEYALWEKPHALLDIKLSKTFLQNGLVELSFADILHKNDVFFWDVSTNKKYNEGRDVVISSPSYGLTASISIAYKF
ncbi:MAG: TonB-dependent receptor [Parafilimonas sp.]